MLAVGEELYFLMQPYNQSLQASPVFSIKYKEKHYKIKNKNTAKPNRTTNQTNPFKKNKAKQPQTLFNKTKQY